MEAQIDDNLRKIFEEDAADDVPAYLKEMVERLGEIDAADAPPDEASEQGDEVSR